MSVLHTVKHWTTA